MDDMQTKEVKDGKPCGWSEYTLAFLLLRLWLGVRALFAGLEKYEAVADGVRGYGLANYRPVPKTWMRMFSAEPLLPEWALNLYYPVVGPLLILLGITLLLGICTRTTLFVMGLFYVSITMGMVMIGQESVAGFMGVHVLMVAAALVLVRYNRLQVFGRF